MKVLFSSLLMATAGCVVARTTIMQNVAEFAAGELLTTEFKVWMAQNDKSYNNEEAIKRQMIYYKNKLILEQLKGVNGNDNAVYKLNMFADVDSSELLSPMPPRDANNNNNNNENDEHLLPDLPTKHLPNDLDWNKKGAVTDMRNQGTAGSCWSFSAVEAMEGAHYLKHNVLRELSPEFLVECDPGDCGVFGGWPYKAYEFSITEGGVPAEKDIPYCAGGGRAACAPCMAPHYSKTMCGSHKDLYCNKKRDVCTILEDKEKISATVIDWHSVSQDEEQIKAVLTKYGPLSIALNASWLQFYFGGISNPWFCDPAGLNHAVLLTGYGEETDDTTGIVTSYWIVKNSWGTAWGESGFFRIVRGTGMCGLNTAVTFPVMG